MPPKTGETGLAGTFHPWVTAAVWAPWERRCDRSQGDFPSSRAAEHQLSASPPVCPSPREKGEAGSG